MPFVMLNELTSRPIEWLVPPRLALGHLHIFDGDPGQGKSLVLFDLAARLTSGRPFPDGAPAVAPCAVVIVNGEDRPEEVVHARLLAAGADLARIAVWNHEPGEPWLHLPSQLDALDAILARTGAKLVILDPLTAFLDPRVNINSDQSVRQALVPLADLAEKHRCAIVLIRHLNKEEGGRALYRGLASIAFIATCRIAWFVGPDPRVPRQFVLAQPKNNLVMPAPSLVYAITTHPSGAAQIEWRGLSPCTANDLVAGPARGQKRFSALTFLADFLKDGPRPVREIGQAGRQQGHSNRTLDRAARELGVRTQRVGAIGKGQTTWWLLPDQQLPDQSPPAEEDVVGRWLRELEKQYPSRDPLEAMRDEPG